jgi:hypothetical protein
MYLRTLGNTVSTNSFAHWRAYIHMLLAERAQRRIAHSVASAAQCCRRARRFTVALRIRTMGRHCDGLAATATLSDVLLCTDRTRSENATHGVEVVEELSRTGRRF